MERKADPLLKLHPEALELSVGTCGGMAASMADSTLFG